MKKMFLMVLAVFAALPTFADERPIQVGQLPEKVRSFVATYFEGTTIDFAQIENRASLVQYEIVLSDGSELQFNKQGKWTEIKRKKSAVPSAIIPSKIQTYINVTYPNAFIKEVEHDDRLYELILSNGFKLTFNSSLKLIDIDK